MGDVEQALYVLRHEVGLTPQDLSRVTGKHWRAWRAVGRKPPTLDDLTDLRAIVTLFVQSGVLYPEEIGRWLRARVEELGYARPLVLLGKGRFDEVRVAAEALINRLLVRSDAPTLDEEIVRLLSGR